MTGSTPPRKRRFRFPGADKGPFGGSHGTRDHERGSPEAGASLEPPAEHHAPRAGTGESAGPDAPVRHPRAAAIRGRARQLAREGARRGGGHARAGIAYVADRVIDIAPRVPVRDLATLRRQFPGLDPEQLADKLVAGAAKATSTVGAGIGAAAMLPVPPALPTELAAEITAVAAIELKLIAELHEVYGQRAPGGLGARSTAYLGSWSGERGIDVMKPSTIDAALGGRMKRELRQQIMKRMVRNLPNLTPFMVGAAVGAVMNRRDTRKLAERVRADLRKVQVPWAELAAQPPLDQPEHPVRIKEIAEDPEGPENPASPKS
ncbi:hypothetical protein [Streptomyces sp. LaPpAH-108]|uniref:hypothetical protein n=1 Tax=Streptomyces sp. LaPpAH-108 TaxID=1155714 RepID=UPI000365E2F3|nr:hypothetical protein [Streptomyces sp. LaPpAH-108]